MSKSREAMDRENQQINQQESATSNPSPTRTDQQTAFGGQTNYGISRESRSDFPRRSTSNRGRGEASGQRFNSQPDNQRYTHQSEPYTSTQYNQQASRQQGRYEGRYRQGGAADDRSTADRASQYQNRQWTGEDSGDFYSRSIRERAGTPEYRDRDQSQGGYRSAEQNHPYANQQANYRGQNRDTEYRSFDSSNYDSPNYGAQNYRDEQDYSRRNRPYRDTDARDINRRSPDNESYPHTRDRQSAEMPRYEQNYQNHFGAEPWFDRPGGTYAYLVRCRDLMTRDVTTCSPETSLRDVAEMMESENIGSIPVVENGRLIGLVTDRDIVCRILAEGRDTRTTTAREAMTDDLTTCLPEESIIDAIHKMGESQVRRLPVCDPTGKLRGILSMGDVALEAERDMEVAHALEQISQPNRQAAHRRR